MKYIFSIIFSVSFAFGLGEGVSSLEADFIQDIISTDGIPVQYKGKIQSKLPNNIKWTYTFPIKKEIYINQNQVAIYEIELNQVSYSNLKDNADLLSILKQAKKKSSGIYIATAQDVEYTIYVDSKDSPYKIEFTDTIGTKTTINLSNVKLNTNIKNKVFEFTPPENAEIVELN